MTDTKKDLTAECAYEVEYTDTFGGAANYCWVQRHEIQGTSEKPRTLVRRAKAAVGLTGVRCNVTNFGDMIEVRPVGMCTVLFISGKVYIE